METILVSGSYTTDPFIPMRRPMEFDRGVLVDMTRDEQARTFVATVSVERYTPHLWWKHKLDVEMVITDEHFTQEEVPLYTFVYTDRNGKPYKTPRIKLNKQPGVVSHVVSSLKSFDYHGS
jgi:hypothetical protein